MVYICFHTIHMLIIEQGFGFNWDPVIIEIEINDVVHWSWEAPLHAPFANYKVKHVTVDGSPSLFDSGEPTSNEGNIAGTPRFLM